MQYHVLLLSSFPIDAIDGVTTIETTKDNQNLHPSKVKGQSKKLAFWAPKHKKTKKHWGWKLDNKVFTQGSAEKQIGHSSITWTKLK